MSKGELNVSRWLEAHCDRNSQISTLPRCILLVDVSGDDDCQLIVTDFTQNRLRAYKGILTSDIVLSDVPNSLITFYTNQLEPRIPAVAVSCGLDMFIYKNNKPFFKFRISSSPTLSPEKGFLEKFRTNVPSNTNKHTEEPSAITHTGKSLESLHTTQEKPSSNESSITCMCTLKKSSYDKYAISCPVLATESGNIYFLDPQTLTILHQANTCSKKSTPFIITAAGLFDVEYKIVIACREGHICILMRGWLEGKLIIEFVDDIVDIIIIPRDNFIIVASSQKSLACFTKRGQNLWSVKTIKPVTCICLIPIYHLNVNFVAVGLKGGMIQLYHGRHVVDYLTVSDTPSAITFGQLGQEENVMVIITLGTMTYKILKRTADFNLKFKEKVPVLQCRTIPLPKRSKLFLEQSVRERSTAVDMLQFFQQDLIRLRLENSSELFNRIENLENKEIFKLEAKILGLGPTYTIILYLQNLDSKTCFKGLRIMFHTKQPAFISTNVIKIPIMPPFYRYKMKIQVKNDKSAVDMLPIQTVKIYAARSSQIQPDLTVTVNLPTQADVCC